MEEYNWIQGRINDLTKTQAEDRHAQQRLDYAKSLDAEIKAVMKADLENAKKNAANRAKKVRG